MFVFDSVDIVIQKVDLFIIKHKFVIIYLTVYNNRKIVVGTCCTCSWSIHLLLNTTFSYNLRT